MEGKWSDHFPAVEKPLPARYEKCYICPTCSTTCRRLISTTTGNPNRPFYTCPAPTNDHKFFKWERDVNDEDFISVPNCGGCSAGICRVRKVKDGPNKGRILFMCRVKEGEGSCGYRIWKDELEMPATGREDENTTLFQSTLVNCKDTMPANLDFVEEINQNDEGADNKSTVMDTSERLDGLEATYWKIERSNCQEEKPDESLTKPLKKSRCGDQKGPGSLISSQCLKLRLAINYMAIRQQKCWMEVATLQNLNPQLLQGWWGRLAFPPLPCLTIFASEPFTYYVSSPLDSTLATPDKILETPDASTTLASRSLLGVGNCKKSLFAPVCNNELSGTKSLSDPSSETPFCDVMTQSISKVFDEAAENLKNYLFTLLETMDVKDHEAMSQVAETTFAALDRLPFDHQDLKERAEELIRRATSLAEIEQQSMPRKDSHQKLVDHYSSEKTRLEKIKYDHAKVVDNLASNKKRREVLSEEISLTKERLFQMESDLSCCLVEKVSMEHELEKISKDKEVSEEIYLDVSEELKESQKIHERFEAEHDAAKAAFDRARAVLRG